MLTDLALSPNPPRELRADACICGAGPAGITLALELARRRPDWHIVLLEGGGSGVPSERERLLYDVGVGEKPYAVAGARPPRRGGPTAPRGGGGEPRAPAKETAPP
ncbi:MAG: hypothetical protein KJZ59_12335, partial [Pararhodobacter sp.]|nr:hypothetical protein [Pararhodobacter sp.]